MGAIAEGYIMVQLREKSFFREPTPFYIISESICITTIKYNANNEIIIFHQFVSVIKLLHTAH